MAQPTYDYIDFMYTALCADGSQIPAVVFTNDPNLPANLEGDSDAKVLYVPGLSSSPSTNTTLRWLDEMEEFLQASTHLIHDSGGEFSSKEAKARFHDVGITTHQIPAAGGAFLNPCDNNFHHDMKQHFYQRPRKSHADMLRAMLYAYAAVKDQNINHYFQHTGIIGNPVTLEHITKLLSEGYHPGKGHEEEHELCLKSYNAWKQTIELINSTTLTRQKLKQLECAGPTGIKWHIHSRK